MENLGYKVGDAVTILGNEPTRGRIIDMRVNAADNHGRTVVRVDVAIGEIDAPTNEVIQLKAERQILNNLISEDPTSFADQLAASRDKEFGRQFGKFLKEYRIEEQLRRVAKEGFTGLTFDFKNKSYPAEVMQLFKDKRFEPSIKAKYGETFSVSHDDNPIRFFGGSIVGHNNKYAINWRS